MVRRSKAGLTEHEDDFPQCVCAQDLVLQWNVTPLICWGVIFLSLKHFIVPSLDLIPCLPSQPRREAIRAFNSTKGATQNAAIEENLLLQTFVCCITCVDLMSNLSDCVTMVTSLGYWQLKLS